MRMKQRSTKCAVSRAVRAAPRRSARKIGVCDRIRLARWAAECAEGVLAVFERRVPGDARPREAIAAARAWARGRMPMAAARAAAFAAHAAARAAGDPAAAAAARAAGHAAATAHVPAHARCAADYAVRAGAERALQLRRLPVRLRAFVSPPSRRGETCRRAPFPRLPRTGPGKQESPDRSAGHCMLH